MIKERVTAIIDSLQSGGYILSDRSNTSKPTNLDESFKMEYGNLDPVEASSQDGLDYVTQNLIITAFIKKIRNDEKANLEKLADNIERITKILLSPSLTDNGQGVVTLNSAITEGETDNEFFTIAFSVQVEIVISNLT